MKFVEVADARVSVIGLGTWQFGSSEWGYGNAYATDVAPRLLNRCLDLGVNLIDTAEAYAFGRSEKIVGGAIRGRRNEVFLATKLLPLFPLDPVVPWRARESMRRLGVDSLDLYQVHWPNPVFPFGLTMSSMAELQKAGLVRHVGVSNFSLAQWQRAENELGGPVLSNQVKFSLINRGPEREMLPWAQQQGRLVIAYSPLSQGLLSGRYDADHLPGGLRGATGPFLPDNVRRLMPVIDVLREVAKAHDATCSQVALAWLVRMPNVVVIPGASSVEQAEANAAAADLRLSDEEDAALRAASDAYVPERGVAAASKMVRIKAERAVGRVRRVVEGLQR